MPDTVPFQSPAIPSSFPPPGVRHVVFDVVGTLVEPWPTVPPRSDQEPLLQVLAQLLEHPAVEKLGPAVRWEEAWSVAARLTELLPFTPGFKQALLAETDPLQMLDAVGLELDELREADGA